VVSPSQVQAPTIANGTAMPQSMLQKLVQQISDFEGPLISEVELYPRVQGFWVRWKRLHLRFFGKLSRWPIDVPNRELLIEDETRRILRIRSAFVSSALQFFHREESKNGGEARLLASLFAGSDKVWLEALEIESRRLRRAYASNEKVRRVIGAYSDNG
jgi:hypothetical protein